MSIYILMCLSVCVHAYVYVCTCVRAKVCVSLSAFLFVYFKERQNERQTATREKIFEKRMRVCEGFLYRQFVIRIPQLFERSISEIWLTGIYQSKYATLSTYNDHYKYQRKHYHVHFETLNMIPRYTCIIIKHRGAVKCCWCGKISIHPVFHYVYLLNGSVPFYLLFLATPIAQ